MRIAEKCYSFSMAHFDVLSTTSKPSLLELFVKKEILCEEINEW